MTYDQAQGARLGQRTPPENPGVRLCTVSELPEVAYRGQIIYLTDLDVFNVYDGTVWQNPGGTNTYVQETAPADPNPGDLWVRTSDRTVYAWDGIQWNLVSQDSTGSIINPLNIGSGNYTGTMTVLGSIGNATTSKRVELNDQGLVQYASDGVSVETLISGVVGVINQFTGSGVFDHLSSQDTSFSNQVRLEQGSSLVLAAAVTPPLTVGATTNYLGTVMPTTYAGTVNGYHADTARTNAWASTTQDVSGSYTRGRLWENDKYYEFPSFTTSFSGVVSSFLPISMARVTTDVGDRTVVLGDKANSASSPTKQLRLYDTSSLTNTGSVAPTLVATVTYTSIPSGSSVSYAVGRAFSQSGSARRNQVVVAAYDNSNGAVYLSRHGTSEGTPDIAPVGANRQLVLPTSGGKILGVAYGSSSRMAFHGSNQDVFVIATTNGNYVYTDAGSPARLSDLEFPRISSGSLAFAAIGDVSTNDFSNFWAIPVGVTVTGWQYENISWTGTETWWFGISWRDQPGTQETKPSDFFSYSPKKRSRVSVAAPAYPPPASGSRISTDVNGWVLYGGVGSTKPANAAMWKQPSQPADLALVYTLTAYPTFSGTSNPLTVSTFTTGTAAKIAYPAGNVYNFSGGDTGDVTCDANGDIFINHSLAVTPTTVAVTPRGAYLARIFSKTSTQIRVRFHSLSTGNALANGTSVRVEWQAYRMT